MLVIHNDLELLLSFFVWLWPLLVVLLENLRLQNDPFELLQNDIRHIDLFPDERVSFVLAVVGIPQSTIGLELKFEELMAKLPLVPNIIPQVKFVFGVDLLLDCLLLLRVEVKGILISRPGSPSRSRPSNRTCPGRASPRTPTRCS